MSENVDSPVPEVSGLISELPTTGATFQGRQVIGNGEGIHWPELDEDVSVEGLLLGRPSGESLRR